MALLQEQIFDTGSVALNYAQGPPAGPPLVLLPGFTEHWPSFLPLIPLLSSDWQLYALDYRGHGKSGRTPGRYLARDYFVDVKAFLLGIVRKPAVLFGHSMGGALALTSAEELPDRVRGVVVGDASLDLDFHKRVMMTRSSQSYFAIRRELAGRPVSDLIPILQQRGMPEEHAEKLSQLDPEVVAYHAEGRLPAFFQDTHIPKLEEIACPVLLLQGNPALGGLLSHREVARVSGLPHVAHLLVKDAGHDLGLWQAESSPAVQAVLTFLESLR